MSASPIPELDCGFSSFDAFIESIIPEDTLSYNENIETCAPNTVHNIPVCDPNTVQNIATCDPNIVLVNGGHLPNNKEDEVKSEIKIVKPKAQLADLTTVMQFLTSFHENGETPRSYARSASTSSIVMSPPLSPNFEQTNPNFKQEERQSLLPLHEDNFDDTIVVDAFSAWESQENCAKNYRYDPKPLLRKNKRQLVPDDEKNQKYWMKRSRNNKAARKSREDRRQKELEVLQTLNVLQDENTRLKLYVGSVLKTNQEFQHEIIRMRQQLELAGFFVPPP